ncbi:hypothetical protein CTheo_393 [Ceratobasidium theobromae]|uniref:Uncharacterized protein n=1 Tax=Ceratobasidium theobromae TaxID=1582974 RepID=A0A5N5QWY5_9AGAM|nr:hypothetical protein CTheo_393 [Ceratobasidium theobromae]
MAISTAHIVSHYAQPKPKGFRWSPKPLKLARKYPVLPLRERAHSAQPPTPTSAQPVVRVQDEHHTEKPLIEDEVNVEGRLGGGQQDSSSSNDPNSPDTASSESAAGRVGMSPEEFIRNALPSTHTFTQPSPPDVRLVPTPSHRLRPSSSLSNISFGSNRSRPPSAMSTSGHAHRSSSRASVTHRAQLA